MIRIKYLPRRTLAKAGKTPHCQAFKANGYACQFPQELSDEGFYTGACANAEHQAQLRARGTDA